MDESVMEVDFLGTVEEQETLNEPPEPEGLVQEHSILEDNAR
jgi:hypothetical protein